MILREYLYVDSIAVRGLLAQMDAGVVETEASTDNSYKKTAGGVKGFAEHGREWGDSRTTTKAMSDAVFPSLEDALEAEGMLEDISERLVDGTEWGNVAFKEALPPGKIVRITAPGYLFDARFVASFLGSFSVTYRGLTNVGVMDVPQKTAVPPKAKPQQPRYKELPGESESPEGVIPLGDMHFPDGSTMAGSYLRGISQVARGMFAPGLHLMMVPVDGMPGAVTMRLQEGRQFLDPEPDVLFARYGVDSQYWTVVGTVGHHPMGEVDMDEYDFVDDDGDIRRADFGRYVNRLGAVMGGIGFTDLPQSPGFSVIPWAVYRTLGSHGTSGKAEDAPV